MQHWSTKAASLTNGANVGNLEHSFEKENIKLPSMEGILPTATPDWGQVTINHTYFDVPIHTC